jgi:hypothetical protein
MGFWNNNNREESKPAWLSRIAKRLTVRTPRGWEMPLMGTQFAHGLTTQTPVLTEVIVALPNDPSTAGVISSNYAYGPIGLPGVGRMDGLTFGSEEQFRPYFTAPFGSDSATSGGPDGVGVTHANLKYVPSFTNGYPTLWSSQGGAAGLTPGAGVGYQYGVNGYGVSTLGGLTGVTAYIKIVANDTNLSQNLTISLSGGAAAYPGMALLTNATLTAGTSNVSGGLTSQIPLDVYNVFFGPTADKNNRFPYRQDNIAVLVVGGATASGLKQISLLVRDQSSSVAPFGGITGATGGVSFALSFDRLASNTFWTTTDTVRA